MKSSLRRFNSTRKRRTRRKLSELEEVQVSISNSQYQNMNNMHNINRTCIIWIWICNAINNNSVYRQREPQVEINEHELDNIMLGSSIIQMRTTRKKYLMLGIVLVVLFLLTIIIIRLLINDPKDNDQSTLQMLIHQR